MSTDRVSTSPSPPRNPCPLAALLPTRKHPRGDRGVLRCHDEAVKATLDWIEETLVQTRGYDPATGRRPRVKGHGMAAALFRHIASRNLDPQLHTHAVVANMTRDAEGRWKSIEPTELHRNAILIGAYYRDQLARRLIAKGYSILPAMVGRMQSFEIAGYDRRVRDAFSSRRKQIEAFMDERGWDYSQAAAQVAALATRKRKAEPLHAMLRTIWADRARKLGEVPVVRRSWRGVPLPAVPSALKIAWQAMRHLEERQSVFAASHLEAIALGHSPGRHTLEDIRGAIARLVTDAHLVEAPLRRSDRSFVTDRALKAERAVIAAMKAGIGDGMALASERAVAAHLADAGLTEGQEAAVRTILLTPDRVTGVQGPGRDRQDHDAAPCSRACGEAFRHGPGAVRGGGAGAGARDGHAGRDPAMVPRPLPGGGPRNKPPGSSPGQAGAGSRIGVRGRQR